MLVGEAAPCPDSVGGRAVLRSGECRGGGRGVTGAEARVSPGNDRVLSEWGSTSKTTATAETVRVETAVRGRGRGPPGTVSGERKREQQP